jgi:hypothetical protein
MDRLRLLENDDEVNLSRGNATLYEFVDRKEAAPLQRAHPRPCRGQGRYPRLHPHHRRTGRAWAEPGIALQPESVRSGEQTAAGVRRGEAVCRRATP